MKNLLVTLAYHPGDFDITKKLLQWIAELGDCKPHSLLLAADSAIPQASMRELMDIARPVFHTVRTMIVSVPKSTESQRVWPPNIMFMAVARQVREQYKHDFLWMEPDGIPLVEGWLEQIAAEYDDCPKRFMGTIVKQQDQHGLPAEYLNGVAVYPNDAFDVFDKIESVKDSSQAFDIGSAGTVVPRAMNTTLIQHFWGEKDLPPIFVETIAPGAPKNHVTRGFIKPNAAIFHRSKDGKLIDLLRTNMSRPLEPLGKGPTEILSDKMEFNADTSVDATKKSLESIMAIGGEVANKTRIETTIPIPGPAPTPETTFAVSHKRGPGRPPKNPVEA